jgi:hypothetical protein
VSVIKIVVSKAGLERVEERISPWMKNAITIPLDITIDGTRSEGANVYVSESVFNWKPLGPSTMADVARFVYNALARVQSTEPKPCLSGEETCEEVRGMDGDEYLRCGAPAEMIIYHKRPGEHPYRMCRFHGTHNIENRGAIELVAR